MVSEAVRVSDGWILGSSVTFISWVLGPRSPGPLFIPTPGR